MMKKMMSTFMSYVIVIAMMLSMINCQTMIVHGEEDLPTEPAVTETVEDNNQETAEEETSEEEALQEDETEEEVTEAPKLTASANEYHYDLVKMTELLKSDDLQADESVTLKEDTKADGVVVTGSKETLEEAGITIGGSFVFDSAQVSRITIDALTKKGTKASLGVYLDGSEEPVATVTLFRQTKKNNWTRQKWITVDLSDLHLTGTHTVTLKVLNSSEKNVEIMLRSIEFVESSVPVIYFTIDESEGTIAEMNASEDHSVECYGKMKIQVPDGYTNEYTSKALKTEEYELEYIRGRGNSTWGTSKRPYKVKLDKKANLLGMGKNKHWVLLANYYDNSLLRNRITYWLGEKLGMAFTPKSVPVDVVMNGDYYGSYYLCQQIRIDSTRVDIADLEESDETLHSTDPEIITGGYLLALSPYGDETNPTFTTKHGNEFLIERPEYEDYLNETQVQYITDYVQSVEDAIYGDEFKNADGKHYSDLMDVTSTINYYWMQEFSMNGDAYCSTSTYLYKDRNGKLCWGPLWDFDYVAWGSTEYDEFYTSGWQQRNNCWNERLFDDPEFCKQVIAAWPSFKAQLNELIKDGGQLDKYADEMALTAKYNFEKCGFTNFYDEDEMSDTHTYKEEIERLRDWIQERMDWVDAHVNDLIPQNCTITFTVDGEVYATEEGLVGRPLNHFPDNPTKDGYVFIGWGGTIHLTFEEFLVMMDISEQDAYEYFDEETINDIKENGYEFEYTLDRTATLIGTMSVEAQFVSEDEIEEPTAIFMSESELLVPSYEEEFDLTVACTPFDAYTEITWSSSDELIAEVDQTGFVTVHQPGDVVITATTSNGLSATCKLHVMTDEEMEEYEWENGMSFAETEVTINVDEYKHLDVDYDLGAAFVWNRISNLNSLDDSIVECGGACVIHGVEEGSTLVYTWSDDGLLAIKVNVVDGKKLRVGETFIMNGLRYEVTSQKTVECIGPSKASIASVKIPASVTFKDHKLKVTSVKSKAFYKCKKLKKVTIGSNVEFINAYAFASCPKLAKVTIGKNVQIIYKKAFYKDKKLKTITVKAKQMKINSKAFGSIYKKAKFKVPKKSRAYYRVVLGKKRVK